MTRDRQPYRHPIADRIGRVEATLRARYPGAQATHLRRPGALDDRVRWVCPGYYWRDDERADWAYLGSWPDAMRNAEQLAGERRRRRRPDPGKILDIILRIMTLGVGLFPWRSRR